MAKKVTHMFEPNVCRQDLILKILKEKEGKNIFKLFFEIKYFKFKIKFFPSRQCKVGYGDAIPFKNGPSLASFLFIFVPIKYKLYRKIVEFSGIRTRIVEVEGEHSDHHHGTYL